MRLVREVMVLGVEVVATVSFEAETILESDRETRHNERWSLKIATS